MSPRLRYGPHAGEAAARVLLREPQYCLWWLADRPESALSGIFRGLIVSFNGRPLIRPCSSCERSSHQAYAAPGGVELVAYCRSGGAGRHVQTPGSFGRTYKDAVRHVVETFPRAQRILLRRILIQLLGLKGGPSRLTEAKAQAIEMEPGVRPAPDHLRRAQSALSSATSESRSALSRA